MARIIAAIFLGVVLGFVGAHMLNLQWFTLVPWGFAGIALGLGATRFKAILAGAVYGFILCFVFMLAGYSGADAFTYDAVDPDGVVSNTVTVAIR